ncbi:MAG TPA: hypothetical protein VKN73_14010, partial [Desulfosalsimonadaceae bacterium]|nr:hypothetical protein [Desulfosalsimonadaceae bacterium]
IRIIIILSLSYNFSEVMVQSPKYTPKFIKQDPENTGKFVLSIFQAGTVARPARQCRHFVGSATVPEQIHRAEIIIFLT